MLGLPFHHQLIITSLLSLNRCSHDVDFKPSDPGRRLAITQGLVAVAKSLSVTAGVLLVEQPTTTSAFVDDPSTVVVNPFTAFQTVGMIPKEYFEEHRSIYCFTERVVDGDTIRVRHIPTYAFTRQAPEPLLSKRGISDETLLIRLYGVDAPETAKKKDQIPQPFAMDAKRFTSDLLYHQMVKVTLLRRDQYGRAVAVVETIPSNASMTVVPGRDASIELARRGLAELYLGGGAEYYNRKTELKQSIASAQQDHVGVWSLSGDEYVSVAEYKRRLLKKE